MITIELMMKFLSRTRAATSRAATRRTSAALPSVRGSLMPPPPAASAPHGLAEQLDERGLLPGEVGDPAGAQCGGQHGLVVGPVGQLEQRVAVPLGDDADAGQLGRPVRGGVRDDDAQQPAGLPAAQLLDGAGRDHVAAGEDADGVAQPLDEVELVAGEDDRDALAALLEQRLGEGVDADRVEAGERLVEDEDLGPADERGGELDALLVAEGQLLHLVAPALAQAEPVDPLGGRVGRLGRAQPVQAGEVGDLLADLHLRVEPALLRHVADPAAGLEVQRAAVPAHLPGVGADQPHGDAHRGRLAGPVGRRRSRTSTRARR